MALIVNLLLHKTVPDHEDWVLPHASHRSENERGQIGGTHYASKMTHMRTIAPSHTQASAIRKKDTVEGLHSIFLIVSHWLSLHNPGSILNFHTRVLSVQAERIISSDLPLHNIFQKLFKFFFIYPLMIMFLSHGWTECSVRLGFNYVTLRRLNCANTIREMPRIKYDSIRLLYALECGRLPWAIYCILLFMRVAQL